MKNLLSLILCAWGISANAATFFVTTTGNDSTGDGSSGNPWATGTKAIAHGLGPGDTVNIAAGFYNERLVLTVSGTAANPITFTGIMATNKGFQMGAVGVAVNYPIVQGFYVHNTNTFTSFDEPGASGIYLCGHNGTIRSNFCWDCGMGGIYLEGRTNGGVLGYSNLVAGNICITNGAMGIGCSGTNNLLIWNEVSKTIQYSPYATASGFGCDADGIYYFGWGHVLQSNYVHDINPADSHDIDAHVDDFQTYFNGSGGGMGLTHDCWLFAKSLLQYQRWIGCFRAWRGVLCRGEFEHLDCRQPHHGAQKRQSGYRLPKHACAQQHVL